MYTRDRTFSSTTFNASNPNLTNMNCSATGSVVVRKAKYEHHRPTIPRFARMAAKQRQLNQYHNNSVNSNGSSWNARSTPSPESVLTTTAPTTTTQANGTNVVTPTVVLPPNSPAGVGTVIHPKVHSIIGSRKSPEPLVLAPNTTDTFNNSEKENVSALPGCYTLFGESEETNKFVSIIRLETGLDKQ